MTVISEELEIQNLAVWGWVSRVATNVPELVNGSRYFEGLATESLLTNVYRVDRLPEGVARDAEVVIRDEPGRATAVRHRPGRLEAEGDFTRLERECPDPRYSVFGNLGLYFRFAMAEMEDKGMFSFHASGLYREGDRRLLILVGGPGAGKTVFLLAALALGYRVLSAEMIHVTLDGEGARFFKGALIDNVRVGTLAEDFPEAAAAIGVEVPKVDDIWATKIAVDLTGVATREDVLTNPRVEVIFPHVERGRGEPVIAPVDDPLLVGRHLFGNLSEKIAQSFLLYDQYPVASFDTPERAYRRHEFVRGLLPRISSARRVLTGPKACMKGV